MQGERYREALLMAACQPTVRGFLIFHVTDETDRNRWQSGLYYPDDTPKASRAVVEQTIAQVRDEGVDCTAGLPGEPSVRSGRPVAGPLAT